MKNSQVFFLAAPLWAMAGFKFTATGLLVFSLILKFFERDEQNITVNFMKGEHDKRTTKPEAKPTTPQS